MIESITLNNIKKHKKNTLNFDKGLNVISGTSNHGKSTIILGLYWLLFNKPNGINYTSFDAQKKGSSVECVFDDGLKIKRLLTKSKNEYHINDEIYKSFRFDVPEIMKELLSITPANMQLQADPYFMLQNSPSEVGRMFNELKGIDEIEEILSKATKNVNDLNSEKKAYEIQIEEDTHNLKKLKGFDELAERIESLEEELNDYNTKKQTYDEIEKELNNIEKYENLHKYYYKLSSELKNPIKNLIVKIEKLENKFIEYNTIKKEYKKINQYKTQTEYYQDITNLQKPVNTCLEKIDSVRLCQTEISKMKSAKQQAVENTQALSQVQEMLSTLKTKKEKIEDELEVCPICEKPFKE